MLYSFIAGETTRMNLFQSINSAMDVALQADPSAGTIGSTTLWTISADDIMIFFLLLPRRKALTPHSNCLVHFSENRLGISCKLSLRRQFA